MYNILNIDFIFDFLKRSEKLDFESIIKNKNKIDIITKQGKEIKITENLVFDRKNLILKEKDKFTTTQFLVLNSFMELKDFFNLEVTQNDFVDFLRRNFFSKNQNNVFFKEKQDNLGEFLYSSYFYKKSNVFYFKHDITFLKTKETVSVITIKGETFKEFYNKFKNQVLNKLVIDMYSIIKNI